MVPLPTGLGALKVTTALFFRPGGKSTQHSGVASDVVIPSVFATDEFGEMHQNYSLPSQTIPAFLDMNNLYPPNSSSTRAPWPRISPEILTELSRLSSARISVDEDFEDIRERLAKAAERNGVVNLADLIKEKEEAAAKEKAEDENAGTGESDTSATGEATENHPADEETQSARNDDEPSPQQREAVQVLADLIRLAS
jgi:carboxyl-terminal processing protease